MRALMSFLAVAMLAAAPIAGCAPVPIASTNASQAADTIVLESTRALVIAELAYQGAATSALAATRAGLVRSKTAEDLRAVNRAATQALIDAKAARDAGARAAATARLLGEIGALHALLQEAGR